MLAHFYHVYADGKWRAPLAEHLWALDRYGFEGPFYVGIVGKEAKRAEVIAEVEALRYPIGIFYADTGWEQVTLRALHLWASSHDGDVFYAHTKGATSRSAEYARRWRQKMDYDLLTGWRRHARALEVGEVDVIGSHWHVQAGWLPDRSEAVGCFAGNFWMARGEYLRSLPKCPVNSRYDAEAWIATNEPRVQSLAGPMGPFSKLPWGLLLSSPLMKADR